MPDIEAEFETAARDMEELKSEIDNATAPAKAEAMMNGEKLRASLEDLDR